MATDFIIPKLGDNVDEATIVQWLVDDGTEVNQGDEILEVETDKAVIPIPANVPGFLRHGPFRAGDVVSLTTVVATIGTRDEAFAPGSGGAQPVEPGPEPPVLTATVVGDEAAVLDRADSADGEPASEIEQSIAIASSLRATPVALRMAVDLGVDLQAINGSVKRRRITKKDILDATTVATTAATTAKPGPVEPVTRPTVETKPASKAPPTAVGEVSERVLLKGIRGVIARRMAESVQSTARVTLVTEVDATELVTLREQLKARFTDAWGFAPGYNDLLALIVANALHQFPYMNARLSAEGDAIEHLRAVNLGMAVDTERGLLVPVIRDADKLGLQEFGATFREMVGRARTGKSTLEDLSGSSFTITSLGIYRVDAFTPVINLPDLAILGIGRISPKPVVKDDEVVIRKMFTLSLVFDHRLVDGAPAARFLDYICELIEEPYLLFLTKR
jgi:pyruvate dehydrogenase E2 component (dihydrolipoamide acetyltransferase)